MADYIAPLVKLVSHVQIGDSIRYYNNNGADIKVGDVVDLGDRIGIAMVNIADGSYGTVKVTEVWRFPAKAGETIALGKPAYWNQTEKQIEATAGLSVADAVADAGNTGDGTLGNVTLGTGAQTGNYTVECNSVSASAVADAVADAGNTGDGTVTDLALGTGAQIGNYTLECIAADADGGEFRLIDPNGYMLLPFVTVGVAYEGQLNFTVNDGAADFVVGDKFTIAVTGKGTKFKLVDPNGVKLDDEITLGVAYTGQVNMTIAEGDTEFALGDKFTIAVSQTNIFAGWPILAKGLADTTADIKIG